MDMNNAALQQVLEKKMKRALEDSRDFLHDETQIRVYAQGIQKGLLIFAEYMQEQEMRQTKP